MTRILGVDPSFINIGFSIYDTEEKQVHIVSEIVTSEFLIEDKLVTIFYKFENILEKYKPDILVYERPTFQGKGEIGDKISHALGVIKLICRMEKLTLFSYTPNHIKKVVTKDGKAKKEQVAEAVAKYFNIPNSFSTDHASDSLACIQTYLEDNK